MVLLISNGVIKTPVEQRQGTYGFHFMVSLRLHLLHIIGIYDYTSSFVLIIFPHTDVSMWPIGILNMLECYLRGGDESTTFSYTQEQTDVVPLITSCKPTIAVQWHVFRKEVYVLCCTSI